MFAGAISQILENGIAHFAAAGANGSKMRPSVLEYPIIVQGICQEKMKPEAFYKWLNYIYIFLYPR
jgi:hypothetical protein